MDEEYCASVARRMVEANREFGVEEAIGIAIESVASKWDTISHLFIPSEKRLYHSDALAKLGGPRWSGNSDTERATRARAEMMNLLGPFSSRAQDAEVERLKLHRILEELFRLSQERVGRAGLVYTSSSVASGLISAVCGDGPRLLDPTCGFGGSLLMASGGGREKVLGFDINARSIAYSRLRFDLAGVDAEFRVADWLEFGNDADWSADDSEWDSICFEPPFSMRLNSDEEGISRYGVHSNFADMIWLRKSASLLSARGRAAILLPIQTLESKKYEWDRLDLLNDDLIEAIISLPRGAVPGSQAESVVWLLRAAHDPRKTDQVLLVNAAGAADSARIDANSAMDSLIDAVLRWCDNAEAPTESDWAAGVVSYEELKAKGTFLPRVHLGLPPGSTEVRPALPGRGLTQVRLANFKSFADTATVDIKPLTLIFGRNSAGKSSVIQSLLGLRESMLSDRLVMKSSVHDFGTYSGIVHRHDVLRDINIGVSYWPSADIDSELGVPFPGEQRSVDFTFSPDAEQIARLVNLKVLLDSAHVDLRRESIDEHVFALNSDQLLALGGALSGTEAWFPSRRSAVRRTDLVRRVLDAASLEKVRIASRGNAPDARILDDIERFQPTAVAGPSTRRLIEEALEVPTAVYHEIVGLLTKSVYLGPLRTPPQRVSLKTGREGGADLAFFLVDNLSERKEIAGWLQRIGIDYELDAVRIDAGELSRGLGEIAAIVLRDEKTGISVSTSDVGFGISQVLPVVAELSSRSDSLIMIEQPEIHLHPALQSELADLLIASADDSGRRNTVIAETHSEHIMLRVQRRIREGQLAASSVNVVYVDKSADGQAQVTQLRLDDAGEFIDEWPKGFFTERFDEIFSGVL